MTDYTTCLKELTKLISSYPEIRKLGNMEEVQELRDRISEELFHFGDTYAHIRSAAERAESNYKNCLADKRAYWREKFGEKRGTATLVENEAYLSCKELQDELNDRNEDHYLAKSLLDRADQLLNSISSRLKLTLKHE